MYGQVPDFAEAEEWYKQHFGLLTSDQIYHQDDPSKTGLGAFMRCDRGDEYADHHTLFLMGAGNPPPGYNHVAYEVANTDDVSRHDVAGIWVAFFSNCQRIVADRCLRATTTSRTRRRSTAARRSGGSGATSSARRSTTTGTTLTAVCWSIGRNPHGYY